ncbi:MAG: hypothetical protein Q9167_005781 [Letrouitia subvulpina]
MRQFTWQRRAAEKRAELKAKIPKEWLLDPSIVEEAQSKRIITGEFIESLLNDTTKAITSQKADELINGLQHGLLNAFDVVEAFCRRAAVAQQIGNCLHEICFSEALERARDLDRSFKANRKPVGPLHGLPISLKDQFHLEGLDTSMGYVAWIGTQGGRNDGGSKEVESALVFFCKTLCLGYMVSDGVVSPHPPVARGMQMVIDALKKAGHLVRSIRDAIKLCSKYFTDYRMEAAVSRQGQLPSWNDIFSQCAFSGEPIIKELQRFIPADKTPEPLSLLQFQDLTLRRAEYANEYTDYWSSTTSYTGTGRHVDGVILPVAPTAAVRNDKYLYYGYTNIANLLDYTCVTFPTTRADKLVDIADKGYHPLNDLDQENWEAYDAEMYHGAPVGLQVMGQRLEEEKMLYITEKIVQALEQAKNDLSKQP